MRKITQRFCKTKAKRVPREKAPGRQCHPGAFSLGTLLDESESRGIEYPPFCIGCHPSRDFSRSTAGGLLAFRNCTHQCLPARQRFRWPPWGLTPSFHPSPGHCWPSAGLLSVALDLTLGFRRPWPTLLFRWVGLLRGLTPRGKVWGSSSDVETPATPGSGRLSGSSMST